jgi:hypothetical protein
LRQLYLGMLFRRPGFCSRGFHKDSLPENARKGDSDRAPLRWDLDLPFSEPPVIRSLIDQFSRRIVDVLLPFSQNRRHGVLTRKAAA